MLNRDNSVHFSGLTHWLLGDVEVILQMNFLNAFLQIDILCTSCEIGLKWEPDNPIDENSALAQVIAWCHQATNHYSSQRRTSSVSPYCVTRAQRMNAKVA